MGASSRWWSEASPSHPVGWVMVMSSIWFSVLRSGHVQVFSLFWMKKLPPRTILLTWEWFCFHWRPHITFPILVLCLSSPTLTFVSHMRGGSCGSLVLLDWLVIALDDDHPSASGFKPAKSWRDGFPCSQCVGTLCISIAPSWVSVRGFSVQNVWWCLLMSVWFCLLPANVKVRMGTWNVRSIYDSGKAAQVSRERYDVKSI